MAPLAMSRLLKAMDVYRMNSNKTDAPVTFFPQNRLISRSSVITKSYRSIAIFAEYASVYQCGIHEDVNSHRLELLVPVESFP